MLFVLMKNVFLLTETLILALSSPNLTCTLTAHKNPKLYFFISEVQFISPAMLIELYATMGVFKNTL